MFPGDFISFLEIFFRSIITNSIPLSRPAWATSYSYFIGDLKIYREISHLPDDDFKFPVTDPDLELLACTGLAELVNRCSIFCSHDRVTAF